MAILSIATSLLLLVLPLLSPPTAVANHATPAGTLKRITKQQIIASISPHADHMTIAFLTSPSSKYTALFLRRRTAPGAGGFGNDFCYIQVVDSRTGKSVWESDCAPVTTANTCSLVFTDNGLEVYDGSRSAWDADVETPDDQHVETLELVDEGDMRIRDDEGNLNWKASDSPLANQECGEPGSPGLGSAEPPFAAPIDQNKPFGQDGDVGVGVGSPGYSGVEPPFAEPIEQSTPLAEGGAFGGGRQRRPTADVSSDPRQQHNIHEQPLVDYTPFNGGRRGGEVGQFVAAFACAVACYYEFVMI